MRAKLNFPIDVLLLCILIAWSSKLAGQTQQSEVTIPNSLKNTYHLSWVWPDTLPELSSSMHVDSIGHIYVLDRKGTLYCLGNDGKFIWNVPGNYYWAGSLAVENGLICFFTFSKNGDKDTTKLHVFDMSGKSLMIFDTDEHVSAAKPIISPVGIIYFETEDEFFVNGAYLLSKDGKGHYLKLTTRDGWKKLRGFNSNGDLVYWMGYLKKIALLSNIGDLIIRYPDKEKTLIDAFVFSNANRTVTSTPDNELVCLNSDDLSIIWKYEVPERIQSINDVFISQKGDTAYCLLNANRIYAINFQSGKLFSHKSFDIDHDNISSVERTDQGNYIFNNGSAGLTIIDSKGKKVWSYLMYNAGQIADIKSAKNGDFWVIQNSKMYKFTCDSSQPLHEPNPTPPPANRAEAEKEIVDFMLNNILGQIDGLGNAISEGAESDGNMVFTPPVENLIVQYPVKEYFNKGFNMLNHNKLLDVWLTIGNELIKREDRKVAIEEYMTRTESGSPIPWSYGIYEFGIVSIDKNNVSAKVCLDHYCGAMCGDGSLLTLHRSPSGKWWIVEYRETWIS